MDQITPMVRNKIKALWGPALMSGGLVQREGHLTTSEGNCTLVAGMHAKQASSLRLWMVNASLPPANSNSQLGITDERYLLVHFY